jgi:hypothetical protein
MKKHWEGLKEQNRMRVGKWIIYFFTTIKYQLLLKFYEDEHWKNRL